MTHVKILKKRKLKNCKDSTSVLTIKNVPLNRNENFNIDIAIVYEDDNMFYRLIHKKTDDRKTHQWYWNKGRDYSDINESFNFEIKVPLEKIEDSILKLKVRFKDIELYLNFVFMDSVNLSFESNYFLKDNYLVKFEDNQFIINNFEFSLFENYEKENIKKLESLDSNIALDNIIELRKTYLANFNEYIKTLGQLCHYCNNNLRTQAFDSPSVVVAADEKYFVPMPYSLIRSYVHIDRYYEGYSASEVYKNEEFMNDLKEDVAIKEFFDEHILYIRREEVPSFKRIQNKINSIARKELMPY